MEGIYCGIFSSYCVKIYMNINTLKESHYFIIFYHMIVRRIKILQ